MTRLLGQSVLKRGLLAAGVVLTLMAPLLGVLLALPAVGYAPLFFSLLLGTIALNLIGAIGAALTLSLRRGGVLLSLVIMPFYVPVLVFGTGSVRMAVEGFGYTAPLAVLGALCAGTLALAPIAIVGALKLSAET